MTAALLLLAWLAYSVFCVALDARRYRNRQPRTVAELGVAMRGMR